MTHQRILIVDDDADFRESLAEVLARRGFQVEAVQSSSDAQRKILDQDFQVALVDVVMPGQDGVTCLDLILTARPDTRVVVMTGFSVPARLEMAMELGASSVIHKPIDIPRLIESVSRFCTAPVALIAESDSALLRTLKSGLEQRSFNVVTARTIGELVGQLHGRDLDLVVLDFELVGNAVRDLLEDLRSGGHPIPLVLFNVGSEQQAMLASLRQALQAGTKLVTGPLKREQLLLEIDEFWKTNAAPARA